MTLEFRTASRVAPPMNALRIRVSTPGRICLFGEHQDYLRLPVIAAAISLRITIDGIRRDDADVKIQLPDIDSEESFSFHGDLPYVRERDYFRSAVNVLRRHGFTFSKGIDCVVTGKIPVNAGTSSSSALVVSWINVLARMSDSPVTLTAELCGKYAVEAEVLEFQEPGGMMDQNATAYGGLCAIDFQPNLSVERLSSTLKTFVLGDSGEEKDTKAILARVKHRVLAIAQKLIVEHPSFDLQTLRPDGVEAWKGKLTGEEFALLEATVRNHAITLEAKDLLRGTADDTRIGKLLSEHQQVLRDALRISTPKIDRMLDAAAHAGAYGGKINGSGGGGCMFAYAPEHPERVAEAVNRAGGKAYVVTIDEGTRIETEGRM